jgi:hypothetical protein
MRLESKRTLSRVKKRMHLRIKSRHQNLLLELKPLLKLNQFRLLNSNKRNLMLHLQHKPNHQPKL